MNHGEVGALPAPNVRSPIPFIPGALREIIEYVFGNAGMQVDKHYPCVHGVAHLERALDARSSARFFIEMDAKAYLCERWIVVLT